MPARQDLSLLTPVVVDPLLDQGRRDCHARIVSWLRRTDSASVLSITSWGETNQTGRPDRAYDAVAVESDLWAALDRLPELERIACLVSKAVDRESRGWFRHVHQELVRQRPGDWIEWVEWHPDKPFEALLNEAAGEMADDLGPDWWA